MRLLQTSTLWFNRSDCFQDSYEGSYTKATVAPRAQRNEKVAAELGLEPDFFARDEAMQSETQRLYRKFAYISCWNLKDGEDAGLWDRYASTGVAVRTNFRSLISSIQTTETFVASRVTYLDYRTAIMQDSNLLSPLIHKRRQYAQEDELRLVIPLYNGRGQGFVSRLAAQAPPGLEASVDLQTLISEVRTFPNCPDWEREALDETVWRFGYNFQITPSDLDGEPVY